MKPVGAEIQLVRARRIPLFLLSILPHTPSPCLYPFIRFCWDTEMLEFFPRRGVRNNLHEEVIVS